jgi:DNA adenine methylase
LARIVERFRGVVIEHRDAIAVMAQHDSLETLHYVDPPYLPEVRSPGNKYDLKYRMYRHEMDADGHIALIDGLQQLEGMVAISGYPSSLYEEHLVGWKRSETTALADGARKRTEVLWLNPYATECLDRVKRGEGLGLFAEPLSAVGAGAR